MPDDYQTDLFTLMNAKDSDPDSDIEIQDGQLAFGEIQHPSEDASQLRPFSLDTPLPCIETKYVGKRTLTPMQLFSGYNSIKIITFSYSLSFVEDILGLFDTAEIIIGAEFQAKKGMKKIVAQALAASECDVEEVIKYKNLVQMLKAGTLKLHTSQMIIDHRKIYLLAADDGRTRVIMSSANMSTTAWNGNQMEFYEYDDTPGKYDEMDERFTAAWARTTDIPYEVINSVQTDNPVKDNPIIRKTETGNAIIAVQEPKDEVEINKISYTLKSQQKEEEYEEFLKNTNLKSKNGVVEFTPKVVRIIKQNYNMYKQKKLKINHEIRRYPEFQYDYENETMSIDGKLLDLHPTAEEVKADIQELGSIFENFNIFLGDTDQLKRNHFKLLNLMFCSPFNAKVRCIASPKVNGHMNSLPLYLMLTSNQANAGKTFMVNAILKLMTGQNLAKINMRQQLEDIKANGKGISSTADAIEYVQTEYKSVPIFIDEVSNMYINHIKSILKSPERCEENMRESQPMIIMAGNQITEPDMILRKRVGFLRYNNTLPSVGMDYNSMESRSGAIIKRLGTALYREYSRRMISEVKQLLNYIVYTEELPEDWYPDLVDISSRVLLAIYDDFGMEVPDYMTNLSWEKDYGPIAKDTLDDAIKEIDRMYRRDKKAIQLTGSRATIVTGTDPVNRRKLESWSRTLPPELYPQYIPTSDNTKLSLDRKELEKRLGYKLGGWPRLTKR